MFDTTALCLWICVIPASLHREFLPVHVLPSLTPWFHFLPLLFQVLVKLISSQVNVPSIVKLYTGMLSLIYNNPISSDIKAKVGKESGINWWLKAVCLFKTQDHQLVCCFSSFSLCWSVHYPDVFGKIKSKMFLRGSLCFNLFIFVHQMIHDCFSPSRPEPIVFEACLPSCSLPYAILRLKSI